MRLLSLTLLALTLHCAEETKLPADAQAAVDKADRAISVIQAKADAEIGKIRQGLIVTLTKSQVAVTKKGDLDGANAVKAKIDALEKMVPDDDLMAQKEVTKVSAETWIVGRWSLSFPGFTAIWSFDKKGGVTFPGGPIGVWVVKDDTIRVTWPSGNIEYIDIPEGFTSTETTGTSAHGNKFTVIRVK